MRARERASRCPLALADFRTATRTYLPALVALDLPPLHHDLMLAYLGLDGRDDLASQAALRALPNFRDPRHNLDFCRRVVWRLVGECFT